MSELSLLPPRIDAYLAGLPLLPTCPSTFYLETPSFEHIVNCLRLLDSFLLQQWPQMDDDNLGDNLFSNSDDELASGLVALCVCAEFLTSNEIFRDIGRLTLVVLN
jgi:hypothetical protein